MKESGFAVEVGLVAYEPHDKCHFVGRSSNSLPSRHMSTMLSRPCPEAARRDLQCSICHNDIFGEVWTHKRSHPGRPADVHATLKSSANECQFRSQHTNTPTLPRTRFLGSVASLKSVSTVISTVEMVSPGGPVAVDWVPLSLCEMVAKAPRASVFLASSSRFALASLDSPRLAPILLRCVIRQGRSAKAIALILDTVTYVCRSCQLQIEQRIVHEGLEYANE